MVLFGARRERKRAQEVYERLLIRIVSELATNRSSESSVNQLAALRSDSGLSERSLNKLHAQAMRTYSAIALEDDLVTPDEESQLVRLYEVLGVKPDRKTNLRLLLARTNDGRLPFELESPLMTDAGEDVHLNTKAALLDEVTKTTYKGGGSGISVPIGLGVRVGSGSYSGRRVSRTSIQAVDRGTLVITSRRAVYIGARRTIEMPYKKLASLTAGGDSVQFHITNRQKAPRFKVPREELDLIVAVIDFAAARVRGSNPSSREIREPNTAIRAASDATLRRWLKYWRAQDAKGDPQASGEIAMIERELSSRRKA